MSVSLSMRQVPLNGIAFSADPLAELGAFLHAFTHQDHHLLTREGAGLDLLGSDERLIARAEYFRPLYGNIRARFLLPLRRHDDEPSLAERISEIGALTATAFVAMSASTLLEVESTSFAESLLDNENSRARFLKSLRNLSMSRLEFGRDMLDDPEHVRRQLQSFLEEVSRAFFQRFWRSAGPELREKASEQRRVLLEHGVSSLAGLVPGSVFSLTPPMLILDKINHAHIQEFSELLIVPSYFMGPHVIVKSDGVHPAVMQYDLRAHNFDTVSSISSRIAVLTDPTRLQICRSLLREPRTTTELAQKLEISIPQASRHLRALRENQIVQRHNVGRNTYYQIDIQRLRRLGFDVLAALHK